MHAMKAYELEVRFPPTGVLSLSKIEPRFLVRLTPSVVTT